MFPYLALNSYRNIISIWQNQSQSISWIGWGQW